MTQEIRESLTFREQWACQTMSHMRYDDAEIPQFINCPMNRAILKAAKWMLGGRDPLAFAMDILARDDKFIGDMDEIEYACKPLKGAI